jgi:cation:H+ antiporter
MGLVIETLVCIAFVVLVGSWLSRTADVLAEKTGLGRTWVGAVLLSGATSLPELATGLGAIWLFQAPDLAVGGIFGSCLFNLLILAILDVFTGPEPLLTQAQISHGISAGLGCVMIGVAALGMLSSDHGEALIIGWFGLPSALLVLLYALSAYLLAQFELRRRTEVLEQESEMFQYDHITPRRAYLVFISLSLAIVGLGVWLASIGDRVADITGLGESFVGALLISMATSLPEVVVSITAIRLNAVDLAVSNVFGSNLFNMAILGVYDIAYFRGSLFRAINHFVHLFSATLAIVMTAIALVGLIYRASRRSRLYFTWDVMALAALYIIGMYVIYRN